MIFDYQDNVVTLMTDDEKSKVIIEDENIMVELHEYFNDFNPSNESHVKEFGNVIVAYKDGVTRLTDLCGDEGENSVLIDNEDDYENIPMCFKMVAQQVKDESVDSFFDLFGGETIEDDIEDAVIIDEEA